MLTFKQFTELNEGKRWDAAKQAVKFHVRSQAKYVHNNEKNPIKRTLKNAKYYGFWAGNIAAGAASAKTLTGSPGITAAYGAGLAAMTLAPHIANIRSEYKHIRRMQRK